MKKIFAVLVALTMFATALSGCAGLQKDPAADAVSEFIEKTDKSDIGSKSNEATVAGNVGEADNSSSGSGFDAKKVVDNIEVEGYSYSTEFSNELVLVLKNKSDAHCKLNMSVDFYDENNNIIDTQDDYIDVFSAGTENAINFMTDDKFATYKYEIKVEEPADYYFSVNDKLSCEVSIATDKAIISATNNGDKPAEFVKYNALFFKNDNLVYASWGYVIDDDSEIKPGSTEKETASCYEDFDSVKVYLDGRGSTY